MRRRRRSGDGVAGLIIVLVISFIYGLAVTVEYIDLRLVGKKAQGVVVGYDQKITDSGKRHTNATYQYKVMVQFSNEDTGEKFTGTNINWSPKQRYPKGSTITIYYDRETPRRILVPGVESLYPAYKNAGIPLGLLVVFGGANFYFKRRKKKEECY